MNKEIKSELGINEDGSSWYSDSGEDLGENGYRCCWMVMGGCSVDGFLEWKEVVCFFIIFLFFVMFYFFLNNYLIFGLSLWVSFYLI